MKKTLLLLMIALSLTLSLALPTRAAEAPVEDALMEAINWAHPLCNHFGEKSIPRDYIDFCLWAEIQSDDGIFAEYLEYSYTTIDAVGGPHTYVSGWTGEIPADVFEAFAVQHFTNKEAVRDYMRSNPEEKRYVCYTYEDGVYKTIYNQYGGKGGYECYPELAGYKDLGNNTYEVYCYEVNYEWMDEGAYTYQEGDVEGVDYVLVEEHDEATGKTTIAYRGLGQWGGKKAVIHLTDGGFEFTSYEGAAHEDFPADMIEPEKKLTVAAQQEGVSISMDGSKVPVGTALEITQITDSALLDGLTVALEQKGSLVNAYGFRALDANGNPIENFRQPVELKLELPADCTNPAVYYVSDDGSTIEKITGRIEDNHYICTLTHFSNYVLVNEPSPEPSEPEASNPGASQPTDPSPDTGDSMGLVFALTMLSTMGLGLIVVSRKKLLG